MNVYFGTIARAAPINEGGSLYKLDCERKAILREAPIAPADPALDHDPNARIDKNTGELVDFYFHSTDARDCVHGLTVG
jgi:hypothetical protein